MRRTALLLAAVTIIGMLSALGAGHAADCGDGGSPTNGSGSCETSDNDVRCGEGTAVAGGTLSASTTAAEFCNEGTEFPLQGRIGAQQDCSCVYADGDDDNNHDLRLHGWIRIDENGPRCRESGTSTQSYNSSPGIDCVTSFTGG